MSEQGGQLKRAQMSHRRGAGRPDEAKGCSEQGRGTASLSIGGDRASRSAELEPGCRSAASRVDFYHALEEAQIES